MKFEELVKYVLTDDFPELKKQKIKTNDIKKLLFIAITNDKLLIIDFFHEIFPKQITKTVISEILSFAAKINKLDTLEYLYRINKSKIDNEMLKNTLDSSKNNFFNIINWYKSLD